MSELTINKRYIKLKDLSLKMPKISYCHRYGQGKETEVENKI